MDKSTLHGPVVLKSIIGPVAQDYLHINLLYCAGTCMIVQFKRRCIINLAECVRTRVRLGILSSYAMVLSY